MDIGIYWVGCNSMLMDKKNIKFDQDNESVGERNVVGREGGLK